MSRYAEGPVSLVASERFRRLLLWSAGTHVVLVAGFSLAPQFQWAQAPPLPVFVDLVAGLPATAPAEPPRQVVDEPIVIPKRPRAKPRPKAPPPPPKAEPEPQLTPEQLIEQLRQTHVSPADVRPREAVGPETGRLDPQRAAYRKKLENLIYANWVGARAYRLQAGLETWFEVEIDASGALLSLRVLRSSGNRHLDESAERAIYKSAPFPPPPASVRSLRIRMNPRQRA